VTYWSRSEGGRTDGRTDRQTEIHTLEGKLATTGAWLLLTAAVRELVAALKEK
jgi:hypothetical protein